MYFDIIEFLLFSSPVLTPLVLCIATVTAIIIIAASEIKSKRRAYSIGSNDVPEKQKMNISSSTILFITGAIFIVISGIAFAIAGWVKASATGRTFILFLLAALLYICGVITYKIFKLKVTSKVFFVTGSIMTAITTTVAGGYHLLGDTLSFDTRYGTLLIALAIAVLAGVFFIGSKIYFSTAFEIAGMILSATAIIFTAIFFTEGFDELAFFLIIVQALLTAVLTSGRIKLSDTVHTAGIIISILYASISMIYVIANLIIPTFITSSILLIIFAQLIIYGAVKNNNILKALSSTAAILASISIASVFEEAGLAFDALMLLTLSLCYKYVPQLKETAAYCITSLAMIFFTGLSILVAENDIYLLSLLPAILVPARIYAAAFTSENSEKDLYSLASLIMPFLIAVKCDTVFKAVSFEAAMIGTAAVYIAAAAAAIYLERNKSEKYSKSKNHTTLINANMICSGIILIIYSILSDALIGMAVIATAHIIAAYFMKNNVVSVLSAASLVNALSGIFTDMLKENAAFDAIPYMLTALVAVFVIISKFLFRDALFKKDSYAVKCDICLLSVWIILLRLVTYENAFAFFLASAFYLFGFIKRNTGETASTVLFFLSSASAMLAVLCRPFFFDDSSIITSKLIITLLFATATVYRLAKNRFGNASAEMSTILYIVAFIALIIDAEYYNSSLNLIFTITFITITFIVSVLRKSKLWFIISTCALALITIHAVRNYLTALSWWVYFLIAGIVLIVLAAVNEYIKTKGKTVKEAVSEKFSDWH